jgi:hypothetical protein
VGIFALRTAKPRGSFGDGGAAGAKVGYRRKVLSAIDLYGWCLQIFA